MPRLKKEVLTIFWANALLKKMCLYGISGGNYVAKTENVLYCILGENLPLVESDLIYFRWKLPCLFSLYLAKLSLLEKKKFYTGCKIEIALLPRQKTERNVHEIALLLKIFLCVRIFI